ncbi:hypothetical protein E2C01_012215 [Portunus trituberculatus]|uniref:Uncharacterized protein n=1 Tax=Portunus trituberculatus TaxID=210409 RepID=A0A5B7DDF3_PORTR|nr:hypothetical protein [Portunus trituberculatus]
MNRKRRPSGLCVTRKGRDACRWPGYVSPLLSTLTFVWKHNLYFEAASEINAERPAASHSRNNSRSHNINNSNNNDDINNNSNNNNNNNNIHTSCLFWGCGIRMIHTLPHPSSLPALPRLAPPRNPPGNPHDP